MSRGTMKLPMFLVAVALGAACGAAAACIDLTPIVYEAPVPDSSTSIDASQDGEPDDASNDGGDADNRPPCVRCLTTPDDASPAGCNDEINVCLADPKCAATYVCALANHCFEQPSFRDIVNCGLPCAVDAGIATSTDPSVTLISNVASCAQSSCAGACHIGDGGSAGD